MPSILVKTGSPYTITVQKGILAESGRLIRAVTSSRHAVIVTDDNVDPLYTPVVKQALAQQGFTVDVFVFPHGERSKSHATLVALYDFLADKQLTRKDILIALGGGVVGDLAGFAAATYLRGIDFVQIPTTLLAQIDSSVGGKTGVDIDSGKNLVGAFWQPKAVICDPNTLNTLSDAIFNDGMAEAIKYGAIQSKRLFDTLLKKDVHVLIDEIITECIDIKRRIVEVDEFDNGERMLLNFGHTLGHAIEKTFHFDTYTHGQGVGIGMVMLTSLSEQYGLTEAGTTDKLVQALKRFDLPITCDITPQQLIANSVNDKKRAQNNLSIILLKHVGESFIHTLSVEDFAHFIMGEYR